jgi:3D (Asp-Asp-Asp) domain-containing protein
VVIKIKTKILRENPFMTGLAACAAISFCVFLWTWVQTASLKTDAFRLSQEIMMAGAETKKAGMLFARNSESSRTLKVTATAYSPGQAQTDASPWRGALGIRIKPGRTLAVSQDLRRLLGRRIYIPGLGFRVVEDLMHPRWSNRVDFCVRDRNQAASFGIRDIEIVVLD